MKSAADPNRVRAEANDPANKDTGREAAMYAAWIALVGTLLSMAASYRRSDGRPRRGVPPLPRPSCVRDDRVIVPANP